jgi:hypothetical protein
MWSLLSRASRLTLTLWTGFAIAWSADAAWALTTGTHPGMIKFISLAITGVGTILTGLASIFWRPVWKLIPVLGRSLFPDLNGTWTGSLSSTWINPETAKGIAPICATLTVRQGLFYTHVAMRTGESTSRSTRVILERLSDGLFRVWYSYNNDPQAQVRHRSSPHEGFAFLELDVTVSSDQMTGRYYTERRTTGDMSFTRAATAKEK